MSLKKNIIYLHFKGKHLITSKSQYQYNYGQYLYFTDLNLPQAFEVHFSNKERGESETQIGSNKLVEIPDKYFWSGALEIYAWVYLHNETDDGETIYEVRIPLIKRARPTDKEPLPDQQSAIDKAIAELNNALNITNENADKTNADKTQVAVIKEEVIVLKEEIDTTASIVNQDAQSANTAAERSEQSAQNSAESERKALDYSDEAKGYAQSALESKDIASQKAQVATDASAEAKGYRDEAETFKNEAEQIKQNVVDYKNETKGYRDEALTAKNDAQDSANVAQKISEQMTEAGAEIIENVRNVGSRYATQAETAASNAQASAESASASASASAQSASEAQTASTNAETYALNSGNKAAESAQSAQASANSATQAQGYADNASASAQSASGYASAALTYANTASTKASEASTSAQTASAKATESAQSATNAQTYATQAESAKTASQTAQGFAEQAKADAITAKNDAESARDEAQNIVDGISEKVEQIDQNTADIASLEADRYKPYAVDTASGAIASFSDGADDIPLKSLVVDINPIQDLHGQENPYPAGGGKNILPYATADTASKKGITWTKNSDGSISFSGTCSESASMDFSEFKLPPGDYLFSNVGSTFAYTGGNRPTVYIRDVDNSLTLANFGFGQTANGIHFSLTTETNIRFYVVFQTDNVVSGTLYPMIRLASVTDATFAPYENICPISGWTEVQTNVSGINVWDEEWESGTIANDGRKVASVTRIRSKNFIPVCPNATYHTQINNYSIPTYACLRYAYDADKNPIGVIGNNYTVEFTTPSNCHYILFSPNAQYGTTYNHDISINYPSTDHDYHPYTGRSINIQLGQTVYGGKLDVLEGKAVVNRVFATKKWGQMSTVYNGNTHSTKSLNFDVNVLKGGQNSITNITDTYIEATTTQSTHYYVGSNLKSVYVVLPNDTDTDTEIQVCGTLAEPIEIQLSPNQINSLYGINNIWADSGDTEVEYRANTKLYIAKKIAEALASLT